MGRVLYFIIFIGLTIFASKSFAQTEQILTFEEYVVFVKAHHPLAKQADLILSTGEANLLKARGGFDPKIEVDYDRKKFKNTTYFDQLNATFKIPTWYGIEFKANFENNSGAFLNPSLTVPEEGLYSAGVSFSLAQGFLINERMAALKQARFFMNQTKSDRTLLINDLIYEASKAYFEWIEATKEQYIYEEFLKNATTRFEAIERSANLGDKAMIDVTEARITLKNRALNLEAAKLKRRKAALRVSNYLWIDGIPLEIEDHTFPEPIRDLQLAPPLLFENTNDFSNQLETHPKILSLEAKIGGLTINQSFKRNKLLPKLDVQYNFLTPEFNNINTLNTANYKAFVNFSVPIFLRKERGELKMATIKLQDVNFERQNTVLNLKNKTEAIVKEIQSLSKQNQLVKEIVSDYKVLVSAEERMFSLGESSLFLINSREQKLIDTQLKANALIVKQTQAVLNLYNVLGLTEFIKIN